MEIRSRRSSLSQDSQEESYGRSQQTGSHARSGSQRMDMRIKHKKVCYDNGTQYDTSLFLTYIMSLLGMLESAIKTGEINELDLKHVDASFHFDA